MDQELEQTATNRRALNAAATLSRQLVMQESILMVLRKENLFLLALIEEKPKDEGLPRT